ncbi:hypothetical protein LTR28_013441 [Elasticomyces elasticus]|nr:hypothetical protein LTR28_013441 [Elasticomyces elasticus]
MPTPGIFQAAVNSLGTNMGLTGMTPDDAWPLLKARLLNLIEGEDIRTLIEDFNILVSAHVRRCIQKRSPVALVEDLELDVRRITLIVFRDSVILPRAETLMAMFSRLSLDSINAATTSPDPVSARTRGHSNSVDRPGTGGSPSPHFSSFNSQSSTLLDAASSSSGSALSNAGRSRAISNTSAGSFVAFSSEQAIFQISLPGLVLKELATGDNR